jgi:hypothetical protein
MEALPFIKASRSRSLMKKSRNIIVLTAPMPNVSIVSESPKKQSKMLNIFADMDRLRNAQIAPLEIKISSSKLSMRVLSIISLKLRQNVKENTSLIKNVRIAFHFNSSATK